ncbi:hypothetical protein ACFX2J_046642 [Malus domestica]
MSSHNRGVHDKAQWWCICHWTRCKWRDMVLYRGGGTCQGDLVTTSLWYGFVTWIRTHNGRNSRVVMCEAKEVPRHGCYDLKIFEFPSFSYGHKEHDEHEEQNLQNGFGDLEFGSREEQIRRSSALRPFGDKMASWPDDCGLLGCSTRNPRKARGRQ